MLSDITFSCCHMAKVLIEMVCNCFDFETCKAYLYMNFILPFTISIWTFAIWQQENVVSESMNEVLLWIKATIFQIWKSFKKSFIRDYIKDFKKKNEILKKKIEKNSKKKIFFQKNF